MAKEWECDDFEDAIRVMKALEELGAEYVFRADTVPAPMPLDCNARAPRFLVTLLPDPPIESGLSPTSSLAQPKNSGDSMAEEE